MSNETLSVVIPTYNRSASLSKTLAGLGRQTYPAALFEVVVVSDGSTDDTRQVVEDYQHSVQNEVRFIEQSNAGPSVARNRGVRESTNDIIVFIDDDVEPVPEFLSVHASRHGARASCAIIGPMLPDPELSRDEPSWITWEHDKLKRLYALFQPGGEYPSGQCGPSHFYSGNASISRSLLVQLGGFDLRFSRQEDVELANRLERSFGIGFFFDFNAIGVHRPVRTFDSWLKIPREYGRLDALRLKDGSATYDDIRTNFENRHLLSRLVMALARLGGLSAAATVFILTNAARVASRRKKDRLSGLLLSGLYSAVYCRAFYRESLAKAEMAASEQERHEPNSTEVIRR